MSLTCLGCKSSYCTTTVSFLLDDFQTAGRVRCHTGKGQTVNRVGALRGMGRGFWQSKLRKGNILGLCGAIFDLHWWSSAGGEEASSSQSSQVDSLQMFWGTT